MGEGAGPLTTRLGAFLAERWALPVPVPV